MGLGWVIGQPGPPEFEIRDFKKTSDGSNSKMEHPS